MGGSVSKESLLSLLQDSNHSSLHCAMVGLDKAGKTTILYRLKLGHFVTATPTIGFNCEKIEIVPKRPTLTVWDAGGNEKLRPLWRSYARCADAAIFVVDATSRPDRFEEARLEIQRFLKTSLSVRKSPVLIFANKQDLPGAISAKVLPKLLGLSELTCSGVPWHAQGCCALTGAGIEEGLIRLLDMVEDQVTKARVKDKIRHKVKRSLSYRH